MDTVAEIMSQFVFLSAIRFSFYSNLNKYSRELNIAKSTGTNPFHLLMIKWRIAVR